MAQAINAKFLTCRYWALGPFCPNVNQNGVACCGFAHWDTGKLASSLMQRGTCALWMEHRCTYGHNCWYEHRHTGVPGLYQGILLLTGINLDIADSARASGFNTFDHEALMNLIWSVKRVILRNSRPNGGVPPPKHPVYPDRYRPSGVGDNTKRKRHIPVSSSPPPFHPIRPLVPSLSRNARRKKRKKEREHLSRHLTQSTTVLDRVLGDARVSKPRGDNNRHTKQLVKSEGDIRNNPIDLLDDTDDEKGKPSSTTANISVKRQKTTDSMGRYKVEEPSVKSSIGQNGAGCNIGHPFTIHNLVFREHPGTTLAITTVLDDVKSILNSAQKSMEQCQLLMKALFNRHSGRLGRDGIFATMTKLSQEIYRAHDGARDAVTEVNQSIEWLKDDDLDAKEEIL